MLEFRKSSRYDEREKTALAYTEAIIFDADAADDALWERLHQHFTNAELVELGYFVALTFGQQKWIKTLRLGHLEVAADTTEGLATSISPAGGSAPGPR
ncbi:MAG TPA: hypothetical protein VK009_17440 [Chloroflexota bacterium]|nr:hypothetical protein [Chloroflexota bacterium]